MAPTDIVPDRKRKRKSSEKGSKNHEPKRVKSEDQNPERSQYAPSEGLRPKQQPVVEDSEAVASTARLEAAKREEAGPMAPSQSPVETRKKRQKSSQADANRESKDVDAVDRVHQLTQPVVKAPEVNKSRGKRQKSRRVSSTALKKQKKIAWQMSPPEGGRFLDADPIFSQDGKHLLLATQTSLNVYSLESSLLVRSISFSDSNRVTAYALSATDQRHVYVSTTKGEIFEVEWTTGRKLGSGAIDLGVTEIQVTTNHDPNLDVLYTIARDKQDKDGHSSFQVSRITRNSPDWKDASKIQSIRTSSQKLCLMKTTSAGRQIFIASDDILHVGQADKTSSDYVWRELQCSDPITSFDLYESVQMDKGKKGDRKESDPHPTVNLALGTVRGSIFVYADIISKLFTTNPSSKKDPLKPRTLHWHREAVEAVRWSHDGNYVLSGGHESVLLLWQLETGKRQELPHLPSTINDITVSPSGTSYALQLADNSIIVLSTSELKATSHIAGIQSRSFITAEDPAPNLQTVVSLAEQSQGVFAQFPENPAVINPRNTAQLIVAVPSVQRRGGATAITSAPHVQTFDTSSSRHISRQALTRNNATVKVQGPEANKLSEPNVKLMQISPDAWWLATVDEWLPPQPDANAFAESDAAAWRSRKARLESYLKFWRWNEEQGHWMLEARIDLPHRSRANPICTATLDLVADPSGVGFATIGEDGFVRTWTPKTRFRNGTLKRGIHDGGAVNWSCHHEIELEKPTPADLFDDRFRSDVPPVAAKLAYSHDGSILAATQESAMADTPNLIHVLDTDAGTVHASLPLLYRSGLAGLAFCERYLIVLSRDLMVWDIASGQLVFGFPCHLPSLSGHQGGRQFLARASHLAVNSTNTAFAITIPARDKKVSREDSTPARLQSHVLVFEPKTPVPRFTATLPSLVLSLMAVPKSAGFMMLDACAEIRYVTAAGAGARAVGMRDLDKARDLSIAEWGRTNAREDRDAPQETPRMTQMDEDDADEDVSDDDYAPPVVRREQLAGALDLGPSFALPPPKALFEIVASLYGKAK